MSRRGFIKMDVGRITADIDRIRGRYVHGQELMIRGASRGMTMFAAHVISESQQRLHPQNRTGGLSESGTWGEVIRSLHQLGIDFGFNKEYAAQRNFGGVIKPKPGRRMIAIPLDPILSGRGVPRYSSPLEESDLQVVVLAGKVFLVKKSTRKSGERRFADFHWLLVPSVNQKGSLYFTGALKANQGRALQVVGNEVSKELGASNS